MNGAAKKFTEMEKRDSGGPANYTLPSETKIVLALITLFRKNKGLNLCKRRAKRQLKKKKGIGCPELISRLKEEVKDR